MLAADLDAQGFRLQPIAVAAAQGTSEKYFAISSRAHSLSVSR